MCRTAADTDTRREGAGQPSLSPSPPMPRKRSAAEASLDDPGDRAAHTAASSKRKRMQRPEGAPKAEAAAARQYRGVTAVGHGQWAAAAPTKQGYMHLGALPENSAADNSMLQWECWGTNC